MNCHQVQSNLSLYLYGELDFATEEAVESHIADCAFCQLALNREKEWHASLQSGQTSVPYDLLASCRLQLQQTIAAPTPKLPPISLLQRLSGFFRGFESWPAQAAGAAFLLLIGFGAGRSFNLHGTNPPVVESGFFGDGYSRVRGIQPVSNGRVRIVVERIQPNEVIGPVTDDRVRQVLVMASRDPVDAGVRVDSVGLLAGQRSPEVENALVTALESDANPAVRMKALEALRPLASDPAVRDGLVSVLQSDSDPVLRSAVIDVLATTVRPLDLQQNPNVMRLLQQIVTAPGNDEYVRMRSAQMLSAGVARPIGSY